MVISLNPSITDNMSEMWGVLYRTEFVELERLQSDIMREVDTFQSLLTRRMTSAQTLTSSDLEPMNDLGSLGVINEVSFAN